MQPVPYQDKYDHYAERVKAAGKLIAVRPHYASEKDVATHVSEQLLALNFNYGSVDNTTKPRGMNSITPSQVRRQVNNLLAKHILQDQQKATSSAIAPGQTNPAAATLSHTVNPGTDSSHSQPETPCYPSGVGPSFTRQAQVVHESRAAHSEPTSTLARINQVVLKSGVARPRPSTRPYARTVVSSPMAQAARPVILVVAAELSRASPDSHIISQQSLVSSSAMLGGHAETGHQGPLYINPALRTTSSSSHADTMGQNQIHGEYMMSGALQEPHIDQKSKRY
jgi:hypothetical protein